MPIYACRKDLAHNPVKERFEQLGYSVKDVYQLRNFVDMIVSGSHLGRRNVLVEAKTRNKKLRKNQQEFYDTWPGEIVVARSAEQVDILDAIWRNGEQKRCRVNTSE